MLTKRVPIFALATLALLGPALLFAQQRKEQFEAEISVRVPVHHLLYVPEAPADEKLPLLVFLHGAGERGGDLDRVKVHGPPKLIEQGRGLPFIVVSPQCASRARWQPEALMRLVDHIVSEHPVDEDRIYLTGLSMGGFGTWALAARHPDRFAAIAPICGGGDPDTADRIKDLPVWVFHGAKDTVVKIEQSERMVEALRSVGNEARFTVYPEAGHDSWTETYENPELYEWFLQHRRSDQLSTSREIPRASPEDVGLSTAKLSSIDGAIQEFVDNQEIAGAVTIVARKGRIAYAKAFGKQNIESGDEMKLDTIFRIYSMTKSVTSVAAMTLFEEGRFQLDDPVSRYLPELEDLKVFKSGDVSEFEVDEPQREMSVRDLLRHTAGLTYGIFGDTAVDRMYRRASVLGSGSGETLRDMTKKLSTIPLLYQPGTRWRYSVSVDVLGHLVERLSGQSLDVFFAEKIFKPLGMRDTGFHVPEGKLHRFAANYGPRRGGGGLRVIDVPAESRYGEPPTFLSGGGGLVSTARDYLRFCQMILNGGELQGARILRRETVARMTRNQLSDEAMPIGIGDTREGVGFGLGFSVRVSQVANSAGRAGEFGWGGAASTHFWISPEDEMIVVALSQYMPFSGRLETAVKPIAYDAIVD